MKILICSDGSEQADRALRLGEVIAAACGAEVTLLGIIEAPSQSSAIYDSLQRAQSVLLDKHVRTELITRAGEPVAEIIRRSRQVDYDLVIIGASRKGARGAFWMSSKSYKIIKEITPPVLSVAGKAAGLNKILLCSGGKRYIDQAVQFTGRLAQCTGASVTLLHVTGEPPAIYARLPRMEETATWLLNSRSELGMNLRQEKDALAALGVAVQVSLRRGSVLEEILREIHVGGYDLVVTGSALSHGLRTYVLGDISREILNRVDGAVLVVRGEVPAGEPRRGLGRWWGRSAAS